MNYNEYWNEINEIAESLVEEAMDHCKQNRRAAENYILGSALHETIDCHQWIIYNADNLPILQQSDNADYFEQYIGGADDILRKGGIDKLHQVMAFWAMYEDVQDQLDTAFEDYEGE